MILVLVPPFLISSIIGSGRKSNNSSCHTKPIESRFDVRFFTEGLVTLIIDFRKVHGSRVRLQKLLSTQVNRFEHGNGFILLHNILTTINLQRGVRTNGLRSPHLHIFSSSVSYDAMFSVQPIHNLNVFLGRLLLRTCQLFWLSNFVIVCDYKLLIINPCLNLLFETLHILMISSLIVDECIYATVYKINNILSLG